MPAIQIKPEAEVRALAQSAFEAHRQRIFEALRDADVQRVGATAVPGALTKGDVDVLVRVSPERFAYAVESLRRLYSVHQPHNWTPTLASFVDSDSVDVPVGVQLVVADSGDDAMFRTLREALINHPALLAEYNALKRRYDGQQYELYTQVKGEFIERTLRRLA